MNLGDLLRSPLFVGYPNETVDNAVEKGINAAGDFVDALGNTIRTTPDTIRQGFNRADQAFDDHTMGVAKKLYDTYYANPKDSEVWLREALQGGGNPNEGNLMMTQEMLTDDEIKRRAIKEALEGALRGAMRNAGYKDTSPQPSVSMDYGSPMQIKAPNVNVQGQPTNINDLFSVYD